MDIFKVIRECLTGPTDDNAAHEHAAESSVNEKARLYAYMSDKKTTLDQDKNCVDINTQEAATAVLSTLLKAEKSGRDLGLAIQDIVTQAGGWTERIAVAILNALQKALKTESMIMNEAMSEAFEKAKVAADGMAGFVHDHPVWTAVIIAVIALGVLMLLAPAVINALGFGALGPVEGKRILWSKEQDGSAER